MNSTAEKISPTEKIRIEFISDAPRELPLKIRRPNVMEDSRRLWLETEADDLKILCVRLAERTLASPTETRLAHAHESCNSNHQTINVMAKPNAARKAQNQNSNQKPGATRELKVAEFNFDAPEAQSVKLAADFTNWEKRPLDMAKISDGKWHLTVPLSPGDYSYRFIVDGEWRDDPRPAKQIYNPFGSVNAVVKVE